VDFCKNARPFELSFHPRVRPPARASSRLCFIGTINMLENLMLGMAFGAIPGLIVSYLLLRARRVPEPLPSAFYPDDAVDEDDWEQQLRDPDHWKRGYPR